MQGDHRGSANRRATYTIVQAEETIIFDDMSKCADHSLGGIGSACL